MKWREGKIIPLCLLMLIQAVRKLLSKVVIKQDTHTIALLNEFNPGSNWLQSRSDYTVAKRTEEELSVKRRAGSSSDAWEGTESHRDKVELFLQPAMTGNSSLCAQGRTALVGCSRQRAFR
uniref:Uncharacterized protein n=1 Tax=Micrurus corallinus TaxID=54390 RepID=A0A2D4FDK5_MICCO